MGKGLLSDATCMELRIAGLGDKDKHIFQDVAGDFFPLVDWPWRGDRQKWQYARDLMVLGVDSEWLSGFIISASVGTVF